MSNQKSQYVLVGGPADGRSVTACDEAKFFIVPFRTGRDYVYSDGRVGPEFDQARYRLVGVVGEFMEDAPDG